MDRLLEWATSNASQERTENEDEDADFGRFDPKWIDIVLGNDDNVKMKGL
jgi:hypothetical protein